MYVDKQLQLEDSLDMGAFTATTTYSTNAINLGGVVGDIGVGTPLYMLICCEEAFAGAGTVKFNIVDEADSTIDSGSVVIVSTTTLALSTLTEGKILAIPIPAGLITQQYIGMSYTNSGTLTAGIISVVLALSPSLNP